MAKKFFHSRVHNTKKNIINFIIIGVCIIGVIICFLIVSNFEGENHTKQNGSLSIKKSVTIEVNQEFDKEIFFSKIENVKMDDVKVTYPDDYHISKVGSYNITLTINEKNYTAELNIVDTTKPELVLKNIEIESGKIYVASDFVSQCKDNSNESCKISFYTNGVDENGNKVDYSTYTNNGTYEVKIIAEDSFGNQNVQVATLTIKSKENNITQPPAKPVTCKYGDGTYDTIKYLIATDVTSKNCAISLDLYKDESITKEMNNLMDIETVRIKKDVEKLNLTGTLTLNRKVTAVTNIYGSGIVGYEIRMSVSISYNDSSKTVVDYKLDKNGKRVFTENPYNLSK